MFRTSHRMCRHMKTRIFTYQNTKLLKIQLFWLITILENICNISAISYLRTQWTNLLFDLFPTSWASQCFLKTHQREMWTNEIFWCEIVIYWWIVKEIILVLTHVCFWRFIHCQSRKINQHSLYLLSTNDDREADLQWLTPCLTRSVSSLRPNNAYMRQ